MHAHAEIIKEVEQNGDKLTELLKNASSYWNPKSGAKHFEPGCLDRAMKAAVKNDNDIYVSKLVITGAKNLTECLKLAKDENKPCARAMLLLIVAAQTGDRAIVQKLFGDPAPGLQHNEDEGFHQVQKAVLSKNIPTVVPMEIARRNGHNHVREELLMKTDVNQEEGYVHWYGLKLLKLEDAWLRRIAWVKTLKLARNGFTSLSPCIGLYLKQVSVTVL